MNRAFAILGIVLLAFVLVWFFPLFHVVSRESLRAAKEKISFNADKYVDEFWTAHLTSAFDDASDANTVLNALREDAQQAGSQFGRTVGIGRSTLYFLRGKGTIVSIENMQIGVSLAEGSQDADIVLSTGLLFGNTVRDATGLLNGDDFPNSQQFNEISTELNRRIEKDVLPSLKSEAEVGKAVQFVGCAELTRLPRDITPLKVVPLEVKFE